MDPYQNYQPGENNPYQQYREPQQPPQDHQPRQYEVQLGKEKAKTAMILGIISVAAMIFGYTAIISLVLGIIALVMKSKAKKLGYDGGECTAATVLSIVGIVGGAIALLITAAIVVFSFVMFSF